MNVGVTLNIVGKYRGRQKYVHEDNALIHYEGDSLNPRIDHKITFEVDSYGNTIRVLDVAYFSSSLFVRNKQRIMRGT